MVLLVFQSFPLVSDLSSLMEETKFWLLLAKIYQKSREPNESLDIFSKAKELQSRYIIEIGLFPIFVRFCSQFPWDMILAKLESG